MKLCVRCGDEREPSHIGQQLLHFVCDSCRLTKTGWDFNGTRVVDMEYESPESSAVKAVREAKNAIQKYS